MCNVRIFGCPCFLFAEPQNLYSLVCVTVAGTADSLAVELVECCGRSLCNALYRFLDIKPWPEVIKVRESLTYPIDSVKFIVSLPYKLCLKLLSFRLDPEKSVHLQHFCSNIAFSEAATDKPVRGITDELGSSEWPFPWHQYYLPGMEFLMITVGAETIIPNYR